MSDVYSGIEAWRDITESDSGQESVSSYLPILLSTAGALGVFPFMILRYMQQEWVAAIVDTVIVIGFTCLGTYVYKTRKTRFASIAICTFCMMGVLTTVYVIGPQQIFWAYPALIAVFYLLRPYEALLFAAVTIVALLPSLIGKFDSHSATTFVITAAVMSSFAFAFSLITNRQREQLVLLATRDSLTGAGNRRHFSNKLDELLNLNQRRQIPASMIMLDLDNFKKVNDEHGHAVGDQILKKITEIIDLRIRVTDTLFRIGGEEFVVLLEAQEIEHAGRLAEQLRTLVEANELLSGQTVTISLGVASLKTGESKESWLQRVDEALYEAKGAGRNMSCVAG